MKANEAPEKIYVYIPDDDIVGTASIQKGFPHQFVTDEYVRKDAFIEKTCEFIEQNITDYIDVTHKGGEENIILQSEFIEDFKNYMKGE